ncbi:hypothetical protein ACIPWL_13420 [Streptomyces sp. NPDC090023]|uniref:terpene synthase family protein n=1 Tax=unclassified Streptomyces TaxID=2593676 RepID=UPI00382050B8
MAPDAIHPSSDEIEAATNEWAIEQGLTGRNASEFHSARFPRLAARMFPDSPVERVSAYARWVVLLFALDDRNEEHRPQPDSIHDLYRQLEAALSRPASPPHDPLVQNIQEQWRQLPDRMSSAWRDRFIRHLLLHGQAAAWEARLRVAHLIPSPAAFMDLRPWANGLFPWDLIETVHPYEVPVRAARTLPWRCLTLCSNHITAWRNDIYSFAKESAIDNHNNYVSVIARACGCDLLEATEFVEEQISVCTRELIDYEHALHQQSVTLTKTERRALTEIATTCRTMTAAHARWVIESGRYPTAQMPDG